MGCKIRAPVLSIGGDELRLGFGRVEVDDGGIVIYVSSDCESIVTQRATEVPRIRVATSRAVVEKRASRAGGCDKCRLWWRLALKKGMSNV